MSRSVGTFSRIWQNLKQTFVVVKAPERFVGEDHFGNRYFEIMKDSAKGIRGSRKVVARNPDQFEPPEVPAEWNSWLRGRRIEPPTAEEIEKNYYLMLKKQAKAREIEARDALESQKNIDEGTVLQESTASRQKFPVYEEYESTPGVRIGQTEKHKS